MTQKRASHSKSKFSFASMPLKLKLSLGFSAVLLSLCLASGFAIWSAFSGSTAFTEYRSSARQSVLLSDMMEDILSARLGVMKFRALKNEDAQNKVLAEINSLVDEEKELQSITQQQSNNANLRPVVQRAIDYAKTFRQAVDLHKQQDELVNNSLNITGPAMRKKLSQIMSTAYRDSDPVAAFYAGKAQQHIMLARYYAKTFLLENTPQSKERTFVEIDTAKTELGSLLSELQNPTRRRLTSEVNTQLQEYENVFRQVSALIEQRNELLIGKLDVLGPKILNELRTATAQAVSYQDSIGPILAKTFVNQKIIILAVAVVGILLGIIIAVLVIRAIVSPINKVTVALTALEDDNTQIKIDVGERQDEIGQMVNALSKLRVSVDQGISLRSAIESVNSCVMMTDTDHKVRHINPALRTMMAKAEKGIKQHVQSFSAAGMLGMRIDTFGELSKHFDKPYKATLHIGSRLFDIASSPVYNKHDQRLGTVIEWVDVTDSRKLEQQERDVLSKVEAIVSACAKGDFSNRLELDGLDGFMLQLAEGINAINDVSETGLTEIRSTMQAISEGDLSQTISGNYDGMFNDIKQSCNYTLEQLRSIIHDATDAATKAGQGDFSKVINVDGKKGFMLDLAQGVNAINEISDRGLNEIRASVQAIANGDLSKRINGQYSGLFNEIKQAFNNTLFQLNGIIDEATEAALAAGHGNFSRRIDTNGKEGFMQELAHGINSINEVSDKGLGEIRNSIQAIAVGDLSKTIDGAYEGLFDEIKQAFNNTLEQLRIIIHQATDVSKAAGQGDFTKSIDVRDKKGFMFELANGINSINSVSYQGLNEVKNIMVALAQGDLSQKVSGNYEGMFDEIKQALNQTIEKLASITQQIQIASNEVSTSSKEIASGSNDLAQRTEAQASNLQETAASMEEISATVQNNSENANQANQLAQNAKIAATDGGKVVSSAVDAMDRIEQSSRKISDITSVIDEIAFQINLLALNAAVEAARAGEAGKGFEVVAAEVRKLAQRSANAAKDIEQLIAESGQEVKEGSKLVKETGNALSTIVNSVTNLAEIVGDISLAGREQSSGVEQINQALADMDTMTQKNSALVEENLAATQLLQTRAEDMQHRIGFFRVGHKDADKNGIETAA